MEPVFTNDAVVFGLLTTVLAAIFYTSKLPAWQKFYTFVPTLVLCYFVPALLHWPLGLIAPEWFDSGLIAHLQGMGLTPPNHLTFNEMKEWLTENNVAKDVYKQFMHESKLYFVASRYLLPASLLLLCLGIDFKGIVRLGPKAGIMFLAGTLGVIIGGPIALLFVLYVLPEGLIPASTDDVWRGLSTIAGSWIGGGGNQAAMKEIFHVNDTLFGTMVVVDVVVANIWMAFLLYGANISDRLDKKLKADSSAIEDLKNRIAAYRSSIEQVPTTRDMFIIIGVAFGGVAISHLVADIVVPWLGQYEAALKAARLDSLISGFFWIIVVATTIGLLLSFTKWRQLEGVGASNWGSLFIFILVTTIGMHMNLREVFDNLGLFAVGIVWMLIHVAILLTVAKIIKAPFFFVAVGSQANIGGAASAPVVASAFSPSLAPVGVLLAVLGYALGTYGALICAFLMQAVAEG
ncbi:MAG: DUF819 family protein [Lewinellaceae bacterium]|nr:DUF819 family protein [Saprospiraceae bacterium]MCB9338275.1 DUF819 family protein [Lewinellaceae bacterium]